MSYFIFLKNEDNIQGSVYKIAENEYDLDNCNININFYKIIEDTIENFTAVKFAKKNILSYNNNNIVYTNGTPRFIKKIILQKYVTHFKEYIQNFLSNNPNHPLFNRWQDYYNQLNNLNLDNIDYPLEMSLEEYFFNLQLPSYSPLQVP